MKEELKIKYEGELNQVDATTLINGLACLVTIVNEVSAEIIPEQKVDIKIKAISRGSFIVDLDIISQILNVAPTLLTSENITILGGLVAIIGKLYDLRKFLKGKKPKKIEENNDEIEITNSDNNTTIIQKNVYNYYNSNININEALNNNFEALNNDPSVTTFKILTANDESIFEANKEEFSELVYQEKLEEILPEEKITRVRISVIIFKIVFDQKYKWEFIYRGEKINANVIDEEFFHRIDNGEKFSKGDILEVELETTQLFDKSVNTYINKCYKILKVFSHILRGEQQSLDF